MRSLYCGEVTEALLDQEVTLVGWVNRRRDHGGVIFIDLRDREGLVQVVFDPDTEATFAIAEAVRNEYVLQVKGRVRHRPEGTTNPELPTGMVEVLGKQLTVLNASETPPFQLDDEVSEEHRLRYRYIDLRRPEMQARLKLRPTSAASCATSSMTRASWTSRRRSSPRPPRKVRVTIWCPAALIRDSFFALPQSPQLFKQLLMMSGMDRYYQIVRCFRDEDLRADRQPEFTQLDIETSFLSEDEIMGLMEDMMRGLFKQVLDVELPNPFPRMDYAEAMDRFGSDKPDLRIPLELVDVGDLMAEVEFKVFSGPAADPHGRVAALRLPKGCELSRKEIDEYTKFVGIYGAKGLAYIKVNDVAAGRDGLQSPILKFLPDAAVSAIMERTRAESGDLVFFGADKAQVVNEALGALRVKLGQDRGLVAEGWQPLWVVDFPMFEWDAGDDRWVSLHHPFTAPREADLPLLDSDPSICKSRAYDMVLNGTELGGGSIRIHRSEVQTKVFELLGIGDQEAEDKFGFLLNALKYGCPPHGGIAFGMDRLVMLMTGASSIREVMAFPKTQTAACLLTEAPSVVSDAQLRELGIKLRKPVDAEPS